MIVRSYLVTFSIKECFYELDSIWMHVRLMVLLYQNLASSRCPGNLASSVLVKLNNLLLVSNLCRDDAGRLVRTERLRTKEITQRVKMKSYWQVICVLFQAFLNSYRR